MRGTNLYGNRETPRLAWLGTQGPREEPQGDTFTMYGRGESDRRIVPGKPRTTVAVRRRLRSVWRKGVWPRGNGDKRHDSGLSAGPHVFHMHIMAYCFRSGSSRRGRQPHLP
jgi:hypothetical protein